MIAGHKDPTLKNDAGALTTTKAYLKDFDEAVAASKLRHPAPGQDEGEVPEARHGPRAADRRGGSVPGRPTTEEVGTGGLGANSLSENARAATPSYFRVKASLFHFD